MPGYARGRVLSGLWIAPSALIALSLALSACATVRPSLSGKVEVLGSWSGAELSAFLDVVTPFEERTGVSVTYTTTRDLRGVLRDRVAKGDPPDISGLDGPAHVAELAATGDLRDLGQILDMGAYRSRVPPVFVELGTADGRLVGVFVRSSLKGMIWYNPSVFQLGPPRSWDELQRMALQARDLATSEWCVGLASEETSGWPGTDFVEQFLLRGSGAEAYEGWIVGDLAWTSRDVRRAFELFGQVVADPAVNGGAAGALGTDFRAAGAPLFGNPPGCLFLSQGSFMPAFFGGEGKVTPGVDYDFFPFPDLAPSAVSSVIGAGDLFGVLTDSPAAAELMRYLVSDEAQSRWVAHGWSLSVSAGIEGYPDAVTRRAAQVLTMADRFYFDASDRMPAELNDAFRKAVLEFTADRSRLDMLLADLETVRSAVYQR